MDKKKKINVLFVCTGNSVRSQMAEGFARHFHGETIEACSAGVSPAGVHPYTVEIMGEAGVDIRKHRSRHINEFLDTDFDYVITVCSYADSACPVFPKKTKKIHHGFDDPSKYMRDGETAEETLCHFRKVRNEIGAFIKNLPEFLNEHGMATRS